LSKAQTTWTDRVPTQTWLFKSEPKAYSWEDLIRVQEDWWDGVRNYLARNFLRDFIQTGDQVIFYQSNAKPSAAVGVMEVIHKGIQEKPNSPWFQVKVRPNYAFRQLVPLSLMHETSQLKDSLLLQKGQRLSVLPLSKTEFDVIVRLGQKS
jgi:predicted RNA-binding protein with PUA-like domain